MCVCVCVCVRARTPACYFMTFIKFKFNLETAIASSV